jgi:hypothetical protein
LNDFEEVANSKDLKSLITQVRKCRSNPLFAGGRIQGVSGSPVFKLYVGGRKGYRLIYLVLNSKRAVLPIFLSNVRRAKFNYALVDWGELTREIRDCFSSNPNEFSDWNP